MSAVMSPRRRFILGGIGAILPIIASLTNLAAINMDALGYGEIAGIAVRCGSLFFLGGFLAYLHDDEDKPFKIVQIGIASPALILTLMANNNVSELQKEMRILREQSQRISQPILLPPKSDGGLNNGQTRFDFSVINSAYADSEEGALITAGGDGGFLSDFLMGIMGRITTSIPLNKTEEENPGIIDGLSIKSTAELNSKISSNRKMYKFSIFIDSTTKDFGSIARVQYDFEHPTFKQQHVIIDNSRDGFLYSYTGWGCLTSVGVIITMKDGFVRNVNYNMCKGLGPEWY